MNNDVICDICIKAIRSRGETVMVGEAVHNDVDENPLSCAWCKDDTEETLYAFSFQ
jgi:hypothetical protein